MPIRTHICIAFSTVCAALFAAVPANAAGLSSREAALVERINSVRTANRLTPLRVDFALVRAARDHSRTMLREGVFAHGDFAARVRGYGVRAPYIAENLAWGNGPYASARAIVDSWLASPPHRANLLHPRLRKVGIGAPVGTFAGYRGAAMVTADFAG